MTRADTFTLDDLRFGPSNAEDFLLIEGRKNLPVGRDDYAQLAFVNRNQIRELTEWLIEQGWLGDQAAGIDSHARENAMLMRMLVRWCRGKLGPREGERWTAALQNGDELEVAWHVGTHSYRFRFRRGPLEWDQLISAEVVMRARVPGDILWHLRGRFEHALAGTSGTNNNAVSSSS